MASNVTCALLLFLSLKEKKILLDSVSIFPSSASLFLVQERWKQSQATYLVGYPRPELLRKKSDVAPLSLLNQVSHAGQGRHPQSIPYFLPPTPTLAQGPPAAPRLEDSSSRADRVCPQLSQLPLSFPHLSPVRLFSPIISTPFDYTACFLPLNLFHPLQLSGHTSSRKPPITTT